MKVLNRKNLLIGIGVLLILAAIGLCVYNLMESQHAQQETANVSTQLVPIIQEIANQQTETPSVSEQPDYLLHPDKEMPTVEVNGQRFLGYLEIPKLNLNLPVAAGEFQLKQLRKTPAVYSGSAYRGNMVIAAHNYNSHFGRLNRLTVGDEVIFTDAEGNVFRYTVGWSETVADYERDKLLAEGEWDLTLFTCTYNGDRRFTLRCVAEQ